MIKKINTLFVTMFGLGRIPKIPGTFGSLATVILLYIFFHILDLSPLLIFVFLIIIFVIIYVIYKISTFYVKTFIGKSVNNFKKSKPSKKKGILDDEGDFIDYEEVD
mgnify:CR=1 FL=1